MLAALEPVLDPALAWAHPVVQDWFSAKFCTATEPQEAGWPAILRGEATLISAPTGSGKTLAAFLVCIDKLFRAAVEGRLEAQTQVVYVSPLKALSNDIQKNLEAPLREIQQLAMERGYLCGDIRIGVRTGDTPARERAAMLKHPPHILVTTPESLYLLLTAGKARQNLTRVRTVIVDEIHAIADDKRGSHLALSLERLDALVCGENRLAPGAMLDAGAAQPPQRIGLSATQNPIELVANFLTGSRSRPLPGDAGAGRPAPQARCRHRGSVGRAWDRSPRRRCGPRSSTSSPHSLNIIALHWFSSTRGGWWKRSASSSPSGSVRMLWLRIMARFHARCGWTLSSA